MYIGVDLEELFYTLISMNSQEEIILEVLGKGINFNKLPSNEGTIFMNAMEVLSRAKHEHGDGAYYASMEKELIKYAEKVFIEILVPFVESGGFNLGTVYKKFFITNVRISAPFF